MRIRLTFAALTVLVVLASTADDVHAQRAVPALPRPRVGLVAGVNVATMSEVTDARVRTGAYVGAQLIFPRNSWFAIQLDVAISQKGVEGKGTDPDTEEEIDVALRNDYVELPVLVRVTLPNELAPYPYVVLGPSLGISIQCELQGEAQAGNLSRDCDDSAGVKTFDFGATGGAGLDFPIGRRNLMISARYTLGLIDVFDDGPGRNRTVTVLAGITF
jgi:hypothetical protein